MLVPAAGGMLIDLGDYSSPRGVLLDSSADGGGLTPRAGALTPRGGGGLKSPRGLGSYGGGGGTTPREHMSNWT